MKTENKSASLAAFDEHGIFEIGDKALLSAADASVVSGGGWLNYWVCAEVGDINAGCNNANCLNGGCNNADCLDVGTNPVCTNGSCS